ncbi:Transcriptional regulatory protein CusR [termite gut metagenome]|uniref:Transcriptional regulatory protein CusR n=1 Tax=termite gut metagenome TaxID=433724 RepID=A0A5J4SN49_9ZZZZ
MKTILFLEDNKEFAHKCVELLLSNNFNVKYADNPEKAKLLFLENKIDIVVIDLMLPPSFNIEGLDFYRFVKSNNDNVSAIFITTKSFKTTEIVAEAMKLGAFDFLDKENSIFLDKLLFSVKNIRKNKPRLSDNNIKNSILIIATYLSLLIILFGVLIFVAYLINLFGFPFIESFLIITTVSISIFVVVIASHLVYESKIKEETWSNILKNRIVNFPQILIEKIMR